MTDIPVLVDGDWLETRLDDPNLRLFDATARLALPDHDRDGYYTITSGRDTYEQEHIRGAAFADLLHDLSDGSSPYKFTVPSSDNLNNKLGDLGISRDNFVVVYDQFDPRNDVKFYQHWAGRLWWLLRLQGFDKVAVLNGGLFVWKQEGRSIQSGGRSYPASQFTGKRRASLLATKEDVLSSIEDDHVIRVSADDERTFRGDKLTYARAGRIPKSGNVYYKDLFDYGTGKVKDPAQLRATFEQVGSLDPSKRTITYCGSGVAASVQALALASLGRDDVAVYDGSMTEWADDANLPLEKD